MADFTVGGQKYRSGKMPARTQFHVLRRMAPILPAMQQAVATGIRIKAAQSAGAPVSDEMQQAAMATGLEFVAAIGTLPDDAVNYILDNCLSVVEVQQAEFSGKWSKLKGAGGSMFDTDMLTELEIVKNVVEDNYSPVFQKGLASFSRGAGAST